MKKLSMYLFLLIVTLLSATLISFSQIRKNEPFKIKINAKGGIYEHGGTPLGFIDKDDIVRDNNGQSLYFIDRQGNVIDVRGKKLGMAKKNGSYYNINGENILNTRDVNKEKCAILDPAGHKFGTAHLNYKLHACAAHCYFLEQRKKREINTHHGNGR